MLRLLAPLCLLLLLTAGCDRAPLEQVGPELQIVSPDLRQALPNPVLTLQIQAARGSSVQSVRVNGIEAERSGDTFTARIQVPAPGLIPLEIVSVGTSGAESTVSESALYLPYAFSSAAVMLETPVGEHAAAALPGGAVLVAGGVGTPDGPATRAAFSVVSGFAPVQRDSLLTARAGHTLTPLPDGRLLVLGGAAVAFPDTLDQLVQTAEVYDPSTDRFLPVALALASPIRRAQHTAAAVALPDGDVAVYLTGGVGFAGTRGGDPFFGPISTLRRLRYEPGGASDGGRLVQDATDPVDGPRVAYFLEHAEARVAGVPGVHVLLGATDSLTGFVDDALRASYGEQSRDGRLVALPGSPGGQVRAAHAGAPGLTGLAVFTGGRTPGDAARTPLASTEVYADAPRQRFALPASSDLQFPRWGHTATSLGDGRILVIGGFDSDGEPVPFTEQFGPR